MEMQETLPNGSGAAAILAAGIGSLVLGLCTLAADKHVAFKSAMIFYKASGPLSGVSTTAVVFWLVSWMLLSMRWKKNDVAIGRVCAASFLLLALSLLLTFPPFIDLL